MLHEHVHLFQVPTTFERLTAPDAVDRESYFVRTLTAMSEFDVREQETYIDDCFKERRTNLFSVFTIDNFDLIYSFAAALAPAPGAGMDFAPQVTKSARGLLAQHLANTFLTIQNTAFREVKRFKEDKGKYFGGSRPSFDTVASMLRGATNMCMCLLHRVMTAPVHHREENENNNNAGGGGALAALSQNNDADDGAAGRKKKKRLTKKQQALQQSKSDEDDGIVIEVIENALRGICEMMSGEMSPIWAERPIPIRDPETGEIMNEHMLAKTVDGMPDSPTVLKALQVALHLLTQKRTYIGEEAGQGNPLGRGIIDALRMLGRCICLRYERELVVDNGSSGSAAKQKKKHHHQKPLPEEAAGFEMPHASQAVQDAISPKREVGVDDDDGDAAAATPSQQRLRAQQQQQKEQQFIAADDPSVVLVDPIVDVLNDAHAVVSEQVGQLIVMLLLEFDSSARTADSDAENIATLLYMSDEARSGSAISARDAATGEILEGLLVAKLVSAFLEKIVHSGVHPPADDQKGCDRIAKNVATFMEVLAKTHGSLSLVAKHAPMLMPLLCAESADSRKAAISLITELVADRYSSPSHSSWVIAVDRIAAEQRTLGPEGGNDENVKQERNNNSNNNNDEDEDAVAKTKQQQAAGEDLHALSPRLVALRDGYLHDLMTRVMDVNNFVRLHTVKQWESLVRRKAVPRTFHLPVIDIAVHRILDRHHLVRCAALSLLRAAIQANWFGDVLSINQLENAHGAEHQHLLERISKEVRTRLLRAAISDKEHSNNNTKGRGSSGIIKVEPSLAQDAGGINAAAGAENDLFASDDEKRQFEQQVMRIATEKVNELLDGMRNHLLVNTMDRSKRSKTKTGGGGGGGGGSNNNNNEDETDELVSLTQAQRQMQERTAAANNQNGQDPDQQQQRSITHHDIFLARTVYLEAAYRSAQLSELGLRLAVDMLASKTNKDMTDSMHFIVAASAARLDNAPAACEKVLLLVFHHDPSIVNAVCDSFVSVYYNAFEVFNVAAGAKNLARAQKLVQMLMNASEGTFAAVEKIIETLAARQTTANQAQLASAHAAGVLARARGAGAAGAGGSSSAAAAAAAGGNFFKDGYYNALWGICDGSLDSTVSPAARRIALRIYGCFAKCDCDKAEISKRRGDIIRVMQAFPHDNLLVANCFRILAKEPPSNSNNNNNTVVNNLAPDFDIDAIPVDKERHPSLQRAVKLAVLHCCRSTDQCASWLSLAEAATCFLASSCVAPAYVYATIVESQAVELQKAEVSVPAKIAQLKQEQQQLSQQQQQQQQPKPVKQGANADDDDDDDRTEEDHQVEHRRKSQQTAASAGQQQQHQQRFNELQDQMEKLQSILLNRRSQFFFILGHSCVKHLVSIEEYERRELQAVSERPPAAAARMSGGGAGEDGAGRNSGTTRGSTRSTQQTTRGKNNKIQDDDAMSKELGLSSADYQRNKVRDACDRARELTCMSGEHPKYKMVSTGVPEQLLVPPIWGKYTPRVEEQCKVKFLATAGAALPDVVSLSSASTQGGGGGGGKKPKGKGKKGHSNKNNKNAADDDHDDEDTSYGVSLGLYRSMVTHRSTSTLALMKLMAASAAFCQAQLPLLFTLLQQLDEPWEVKTGIVMGLGDLACTHPNMLLPFMKIASSGFYALLADPDIRVRSVAIQICTHLVLNDMLLVGDHVHTIVRLAADPDPTIRHSAEAFCQYLAVKRQKELHNIIPPLVKALSVTEEVGGSSSAAIAAAAAAAAEATAQEDAAAPTAKTKSDNDDDDDEDEDSDNGDDAASAKPKTKGKKSTAAAASAPSPKGKKKQNAAASLLSGRRLPPMSESDFRQAISTLLENVEKGAATDSLIQKLCDRFTRFTDDDEEMIQLNRNIAFCLSELPFSSEREVKRMTSENLFEKYKDWLRDEVVAELFDKIITKMRRNSSGVGRGGAAAAAAREQEVAGDGAAGTERRDKILIEEWVNRLQAAAVGTLDRKRGGAAGAAASSGTQQQGDDDNTSPTAAAPGGKKAKAVPKKKAAAAVSKKAAGRRRNNLVDDSTDESDSSDSDDDDEDSDSEDAPPRPAPKAKGKGKRGGAAGKKAAPKKKASRRRVADSDDGDDDDGSSSNNDSSSGDDDDDVPLAGRRKKASGKRGGKR